MRCQINLSIILQSLIFFGEFATGTLVACMIILINITSKMLPKRRRNLISKYSQFIFQVDDTFD